MRQVDDPALVPDGAVVAVGVFDGVHRGHQAVLARLRTRADERGVPAAVVLLPPPPATRLLTSLPHKLELLAASGVDDVCLGAGTGALDRFEPVDAVPLVHDAGGGVVSANAIRAALSSADIARATAMLGRPYELRGIVEHGDHRGRALGFPTANIAVPGDVQLPAAGIYAGRYLRPDGTAHVSAISIGRRPTFYAERGLLLVEAYLLDFGGELYGEQGRLQIEAWLRGEARFDAVDDLIAQMRRDIEETRRIVPTI